MLMNIHPSHRAARSGRNPQRRISCSTCDIKKSVPRGKLQPCQKPVLLVRRVPAVLSDVLAIGLAPDFGIYLGLEVAVIQVVVSHFGRRLRFTHCDLDTFHLLFRGTILKIRQGCFFDGRQTNPSDVVTLWTATVTFPRVPPGYG